MDENGLTDEYKKIRQKIRDLKEQMKHSRGIHYRQLKEEEARLFKLLNREVPKCKS